MNRLILIGNGFDLAHNMKTKYSDFIFAYMRSCFIKARQSGCYNDGLIYIKKNHTSELRNIEEFTELSTFYPLSQQLPIIQTRQLRRILKKIFINIMVKNSL